MTHIVEHKSFRYTWELVRHTYLLDLESEIEIRQVEISPSGESRLLEPPYPFTPFFELEIDQIQRNGKTVFSFRNICPVEIKEKPDWFFLPSLINTGSSRVSQRFQLQEAETETRWLYTDDFFLISLSSGDRHDLDMLLSLIIGKLNMIALSIQSGKRIRSEFENQEKYRAAMSTMFSGGVDGAFRDVPVYQQHGEMTGSEIDISAALMSAEMQDLNAVVASEENAPAAGAVGKTRPGPATDGDSPAERIPPQGMAGERSEASSPPGEIFPSVTTPGTLAEDIPEEVVPESPVLEMSPVPEDIPEEVVPESPVPEMSPVPEDIPEEVVPESPVPEMSPVPEDIPEEVVPESPVPEMSPVPEVIWKGRTRPEIIPEPIAPMADTSEDRLQEPVPDEEAPVTFFPASRLCRNCGTAISGTAKFCKNCGTAVTGITPPAEPVPAAQSCSSCGAEVSGTAKFCGSCGMAVSPEAPSEKMPSLPGAAAHPGGDTTPAPPLPEVKPGINIKTIEELNDLSWLSE